MNVWSKRLVLGLLLPFPTTVVTCFSEDSRGTFTLRWKDKSLYAGSCIPSLRRPSPLSNQSLSRKTGERVFPGEGWVLRPLGPLGLNLYVETFDRRLPLTLGLPGTVTLAFQICDLSLGGSVLLHFQGKSR